MATTINRNLTQTARDLGVSLGALLKANPQLRDPDNIRAGTRLNVPGKRKLSARDNARQMSRILSLSSTGATGGATFGQLQSGTGAPAAANASAASTRDQSLVTLTGDTAAPAPDSVRTSAQDLAARLGQDLPPGRPAGGPSAISQLFAQRYGVTQDDPDRGADQTVGGRDVFSTIRQRTLTSAVSRGDPRDFGARDMSSLAATSGQANSAAESPKFISHLNSLINSDDRNDRRRAERISQNAPPDSPVALEFDVGTLIRERSEGRLPGVASQRVWDEIAARMGTGITGTELLIQEGYIPSPYQAEVWLLTDDLPHYSALSTFGSSSFASRRANTGGGGSSSNGRYLGGSNVSNLYNWHVKITV